MGIENLLKELNHIMKSKHLKDFDGKAIGIDGYCWLHSAIYCDNMDLAFNPESMAYVYFLKAKIAKFLKHGVRPVMVFDGNRLPIKNSEDSDREFRRNAKQKTAVELHAAGDFEKATKLMIASLDITPEMVFKFSEVLTQMGVEFIVAPYEADAQLAYLSKINYIDVVCTEDSDLILYGCKSIIYKLKPSGHCMQIDYADIFKVYSDPKVIAFHKITPVQFTDFGILSGCDFFKLKNISSRSAFKLILDNESFENSVPSLKRLLKLTDMDEITLQFKRARNTFKHQIIYDPYEKHMKHLNSIETLEDTPDISIFNFLGSILSDETAELIANCVINPITLKYFI